MRVISLNAPSCVALAIALLSVACDDDRREPTPSPTTAATPRAKSPRAGDTEPAAYAKKPEPLSDAEITRAVKEELTEDPGIDGAGIEVTTHDGIVQLSGELTNMLAKDRAAAVARSIRGVRSVSDLTMLKLAKRPDADIAREVESMLLLNAATDSFDTDATARDGIVTLTGKHRQDQRIRFEQPRAGASSLRTPSHS